MPRALAALLLLAPAAGLAAGRGAALRVSAEVRRSVAVTIDVRGATPQVVVSAGGAVVWAGPLAAARAAREGAVRAEPSARHPGHVVVTVLADVRN